MAPLDIDTALEWRGRTVVDRDGDKIGKLEELYLDESDRPAWGAVTTGVFGRRQSFVPLSDLRAAGDDLQVPYEKDRVEDAPNVDPDEQLSGEEEERLHRHYGMATGDADLDAGEAQTAAGGRSEGTERAEPTAATGGAEAAGTTAGERDADDGRAPVSGEGAEMIRSEEEVSIGTRRRATHRARLKKYVVTEHVKQVVPVQREEVRVEYEPAEGEDAARDQPAREDVVHDDAERDDAARDEPARDERGRGD